MDYLLPAFRAVCMIFTAASIYTGGQAVLYPVTFSREFGIALKEVKDAKTDPAHTWVSLMGIRQLGTGVTLLAFSLQGKWVEAATLLSIIGVLVAGTDGIYLARAGNAGQARFHAIPGACIATLSAAVVYNS